MTQPSAGSKQAPPSSRGSATRPPSAAANAPVTSGSRVHAIENLVCFMIANRSYALDVTLVREVVSVGTVFPVPKTPAPVLGVFSLRGATVALVDTPLLLRLATSGEPHTALVIVRNHQTVCGLTIDRVVGVTRFVDGHFIAADPEREPAEVIGFMPDERGGLLTVLESSVILTALNKLRVR